MKHSDLGLKCSTRRLHKREFRDEMGRVAPWVALTRSSSRMSPMGWAAPMLATVRRVLQEVVLTLMTGAVVNASLIREVRLPAEVNE